MAMTKRRMKRKVRQRRCKSCEKSTVMDDLIPVFFPLVVSRLVHGGRGSRRRTSEQTSVGDRLSESQLYCDVNYVTNDIAWMLVKVPIFQEADKNQ